jgi:hypothetical protein
MSKTDTKLRFVCVEMSTGDQCTEPYIISCKAYDILGGNLIKARDMLIKQARAKYIEEWKPVPGEDEPASQAICKFQFRSNLVGYYHFDNGLTFLFEESSPMYQLIAAGNPLDGDFAIKLWDLFDFHQEKAA